MNENELVYALYVQANPVPNPDLLPLTPAETKLLTLERSQDMDAQQRIEVRPTQPIRRRRAFALGFAAFLVVIGAVVAVAMLITGGSDEPVAAADAAPQITFDGNSCRYDGPTLIEEGLVKVAVINATNDRFTAAAFSLAEPALNEELQRLPLGTDIEASADSMPAGLAWHAEMLAQSEATKSIPIRAGSHLIDCVAADHAWRADTLVEVVAP